MLCSTLADAQSGLAKLENKRSNYGIRRDYRTIVAPQDGYITKAIKTGVGGIVKEGESLVTIMPKNHDLAAELYVSAIDLPLLGLDHEGNIHFFYKGDKTFAILIQEATEDNMTNKPGFDLIEKSFRVE